MKNNSYPLKKLVEIGKGISLSRYTAEDGEFSKALVQNRHLENLYVAADLERVRLNVSNIKRYELQLNDVVVSRSFPLKASLVDRLVAGSLAGQNLVILRPEARVDSLYLAIVLRSQWMSDSLHRLYFGSTIKTINISQLSDLEIPLPNLSTQQELAQLFLSAEKAQKAALSALKTRHQILEYILDKTLEEAL